MWRLCTAPRSERAVGKADDDLKLPLLEKDKRSEVVLARVLLEKDRDRNLDKDRDSNSEIPHPDRERERDLERDRGSRLLWDTRRASAGAPTVLSAREADA